MGSRIKYQHLPESGLFQLNYVLPAGFEFPFHFGYIPSTLGEDGDPLDILILDESPLISGTFVEVALLGVIRVEQYREDQCIRNDRFIGKLRLEKSCSQKFDAECASRIIRFLENVSRARGRIIKVLGTGDETEAWELIENSAIEAGAPAMAG